MRHKPVMLEEALRQLAVKSDGVYVDCTFGRGGHSSAILARLGAAGRLLAMDRDSEAVASESAEQLLEDPRFSLFHISFNGLSGIAREAGVEGRVDGLLLDLGVSSPQLDNPDRGFSFLRDGPLDMRMDSNSGQTAAQWLADVSEKELVRVLFDYGEERFARRIAKAIIEARSSSPLSTTKQLTELVVTAVPFVDRHKHPATRTFQAIRIAVNKELEQLQDVLRQSLSVLKPGGRLVVISFHSLEDRIVKRFIKDESGGKFDPGKLPVKEADIAKGVLIKIGKAIKAGDEEASLNPRARSAIMRVAERV